MAHRNAPLTPEGRRRLCERVDAGRPICHVAAEAGVARQTLAKWHSRWCVSGEAGLVDRSSRPLRSPRCTDSQVEDVVEYLRRNMKLGPVMLAGELLEFGVVPSSLRRRSTGSWSAAASLGCGTWTSPASSCGSRWFATSGTRRAI